MRIIATGDRNWYAPDPADQIVARLIARYGPGIVVVHGAAAGIDSSFVEAADEMGVEHEQGDEGLRSESDRGRDTNVPDRFRESRTEAAYGR
jgi:hypothetical protein